MTIYENKWCKIINKNGYYVLTSKSGKYNDQLYTTLDAALKAIGLTKLPQASK